jgi:hypothetical protein
MTTVAQRERIIREAIAFIEARKRYHKLRFALEVGEYLFEHVYRSDRSLFRSGSSPEVQTIDEIATDKRVEITRNKLYQCIHTYLLSLQYKRVTDLPFPDICLSSYSRMFKPFESDPETLARVVIWVHEYKIPFRMVDDIAGLIGPFLARGGKLDDLLVGHPSEDTPINRINRIVRLTTKKVFTEGLPPIVRERTLKVIDQILAELD